MPRVLILDNSLDPDLYRPVEHWRRDLGCDLVAVRLPAGERPETLEGFTHALVTGSEATITGDDDWIEAGCDAIRDLAGRGVPILGSCFGHQQVVRALAGKAHVRRSPSPEFGWIRLDRAPAGADDPLARVLPDPAWVYAAHFDEVWPLPPDWTVLAASERCAHAVVRWNRGPVWGFQHHPEIRVDEGRTLYREFQDRLPDRRDLMQACHCPTERDSQVTAAVLRAFLGVSRSAS